MQTRWRKQAIVRDYMGSEENPQFFPAANRLVKHVVAGFRQELRSRHLPKTRWRESRGHSGGAHHPAKSQFIEAAGKLRISLFRK